MKPIIVGGGPAGSAAAIHLARAGIKAILLERNAVVGDALCGGFLSWRTCRRLTDLGLDLDALGAQPIAHMAIFVGDKHYDAPLPAPALGVSRRSLDGALLALARKAGADVRLGTAVRAFEASNLRLESGKTLVTDTLFLATGKHDLRGLPREAKTPADQWLGLRIRLPPSPVRSRLLANRIELHLFRGGYAGLMLQEDGSSNFCLATTKRVLADMGATAGSRASASPSAFLARLATSNTRLAERLDCLPEQIDAIGHIPYGWRARRTEPGIFRLGDQAGVIPSFAGEGIGIALASAEAAVAAWRRNGEQAAISYQRNMATDLARPIAVARLITVITCRPGLARSILPLAMRTRLPGWLANASRTN